MPNIQVKQKILKSAAVVYWHCCVATLYTYQQHSVFLKWQRLFKADFQPWLQMYSNRPHACYMSIQLFFLKGASGNFSRLSLLILYVHYWVGLKQVYFTVINTYHQYWGMLLHQPHSPRKACIWCLTVRCWLEYEKQHQSLNWWSKNRVHIGGTVKLWQAMECTMPTFLL